MLTLIMGVAKAVYSAKKTRKLTLLFFFLLFSRLSDVHFLNQIQVSVKNILWIVLLDLDLDPPTPPSALIP